MNTLAEILFAAILGLTTIFWSIMTVDVILREIRYRRSKRGKK